LAGRFNHEILNLSDHRGEGDAMYPVKRFEQVSPMVSKVQSGRRNRFASTRVHLRMHTCTAALIAADLVAFGTATFVAFVAGMAPQSQPYARAIENLTALGAAWHGWGTLLVLVCLLSHFGSRGHYTSRVPFWTQMGDVVIAIIVAFACDIFITIAVYDRPVQLEGLLRWVLLCPCLLLLRTAARQILSAAGWWTLRTLIVAAPNEVESARAALTSDSALGYRLVGSVSPQDAAVLGDDELLHMVAMYGADFVVVSVGGSDPEVERAALGAVRRTSLPIALVPTMEELPVTGFRQHYFLGHDIVMLVSQSNLTRPFSQVLKWAFDQTAALALVILLSPLLCALAIMVRRDGGPALFRHRRIGAGGRMFDCIKFRTMVVNADEVLRKTIRADAQSAAEWAATQKLRDDPRVTRIGSFLRRSSLDELPQLLNVLHGEMSLVGPRPIVQAEVARYGSDIEYYYAAKPGLTGLWQVSGRSDMSYARRVRLDVWYVRNWTLWHDIAILFKTLPAVFLQRGAH
jgi:Undecaprenyl-phosphate galactose phosphotransferase WbaP